MVAQCEACKGNIGSAQKRIKCSQCQNPYHSECVNYSNDSATSRTLWKCPNCIASQKKVVKNDSTPVRSSSILAQHSLAVSNEKTECNNTSTPVRNVCGELAQSAALGEVTASSTHLDAGVKDAGVLELRGELAECVAEMRELRKELMEYRTSVAGIVDQMEHFEKRLEVLEQRKDGTGSEEVVELERTVKQLKLELNDRDQEALLSDLEIGHLPEEKGENVVHAITVLATRLGVRLEERDVVFAERVGITPNAVEMASREDAEGEVVVPRARRVVVRLARRHLRDELLQAARVRRTLTATDTGRAAAGATSPRIFLNERLTRTNRQLFYRVREQCRKLQWRFSWTRRGRIYARQADGKMAYHLRSETDLSRVFGLD